MIIFKVAITLVALFNLPGGNLVDAVSLDCFTDSIDIFVPNATEPAGFTDGDIQLILGDSDVCDNVAGTVESECIATRYSQGFSFEITNFTKCSPTYKSQNDVLSIQYKVARYPHTESGSLIRRTECGHFYVQCDYYYNKTVNMTSEQTPLDVSNLQPVDPVAANLTANSSYSVDLEFTTGDYTAAETCLVANLGDMIHVRARVTPNDADGSAEDWAVSVANCFATQDGSSLTPKYDIIDEHGCVVLVDHESSADKGINAEGDAAQAEFFFKSFIWRATNENELYVHCDVIVCPKELGVCVNSLPTVHSCSKKVSSRFRRSSDIYEHAFRKTVVSRPLSISRAMDTHNWTPNLNVLTRTARTEL